MIKFQKKRSSKITPWTRFPGGETKRRNGRCLRSFRLRGQRPLTLEQSPVAIPPPWWWWWKRMAMRDAPKKKDACCCRRFKPSQSIRFEVDPITFANGTPFSLSLCWAVVEPPTRQSRSCYVCREGVNDSPTNRHEIYISAKRLIERSKETQGFFEN